MPDTRRGRPPGRRNVTPAQVRRIRAARADGETLRAIAVSMRLSVSTVSRVAHAQTYASQLAGVAAPPPELALPAPPAAPRPVSPRARAVAGLGGAPPKPVLSPADRAKQEIEAARRARGY